MLESIRKKRTIWMEEVSLRAGVPENSTNKIIRIWGKEKEVKALKTTNPEFLCGFEGVLFKII